MTENKSRRPRRSSHELRNDILNAATEIIGEDGFAKSSLMRIANLANVESTVFHRHFGNWEEFMDCFTRKYDYWFSDVVDSVEKNQCVEKEFSSTLHRLFDELNEDVIMQKLLKWEIHDANVITKRTARMREFNTMPLIRHYQRALGETDIRIGAVLALLMGGIYFFVNFHPVGFKNGKKLKRFVFLAPDSEVVIPEGNKLELVIRNWDDYHALDAKGNIILDFVDKDGNDVSTDEDRMFVDLNGFSYLDRTGKRVHIERCWYEDDKGKEVEPDTITGEYSDMPHVLSFLGRSYDQVFNILMQDDKIASLMAPFKSAYENKANDQLEGMVGTLRVNAARLVSPEAYWVFTGDDFDLKISDKANPSYLVIANDPEKEQVIGSLNALVLNRLITRVNSKGNIPVSIIVDELPTLYFHKIDRLIGTARSNKVAVTLGFQELPQLEADYGKVGMQKIITTCGNIFMGAARNKETLEWAQNDVFGKAKQTSRSISINDNKVSTTISEKMDYLVPAAKIADMATGWLAGQAARDFTATDNSMLNHFDIEQSEEFKTTKYFCKTHFDMKKIKDEEDHYVPLPKIYEFKNDREKEIMLNRNFKRVNDEVEKMVKELLGMA